MAYGFLDIAGTPAVRAAQAAMGADRLWTGRTFHRDFDRFTAQEVEYIAARDSFYLATVSETGWPYVQHRGGPAGFLKVIDERTLAFPDFSGNRQYISVGNLAGSTRASLILMDYPGRRRLKIYAHVELTSAEAQPDIAAAVALPGYKAKVERLFVLRLAAFDWNCPQHITPRFTEAEISDATKPLLDRVERLEAENAALKARLAPPR